MYAVEVADVEAVENPNTDTVVLSHNVVLQLPSALTKYTVVESGLTTGEMPEPTMLPTPHEPAYQFHVAAVP